MSKIPWNFMETLFCRMIKNLSKLPEIKVWNNDDYILLLFTFKLISRLLEKFLPIKFTTIKNSRYNNDINANQN